MSDLAAFYNIGAMLDVNTISCHRLSFFEVINMLHVKF